MKVIFINSIPLYKAIIKAFHITVFLILLSNKIFSQSGGQPGQFLSYGVGARALGMGGAFYAISDDATAAYWNPAALSALERKEFSFMQAQMFEQTTLNFIGYVHPTVSRGTFGFFVNQMKSDGFEKVSIKVDPDTNEIKDLISLGSFSVGEQAIGFSWGRNVSRKLAFGVSIKNIARVVDTSKDSFNTIDLAMLYSVSKVYKFACGVQNIFSKKSGDTDDEFPLVFKIGQSFSLFKGSLIFDLDLTKVQNGGQNIRFGGEYWPLYWASFRFGIMATPQIQEASFGIGLKYKGFNLDVAQGIHSLGNTTKFSVGLRFGESKKAIHEGEIRAIVRQAFNYFKAGHFSKAVERLKVALDADPGNDEVRRMLDRLNAAVTYVPNATGTDEVETLIRRGIVAYVDGKDLRSAVNVLRYAYNKRPKDEKLLSLLNMVEREAGVSELTRRPEGPEIFTLVDQKIYDARQAIYEGKYDVALRRAQDILDLEPNNETALEIMGSAFFLMDQKDKAKAIWEKVLEINPNNKMVKQFLD
ncbi:MAG: PorV/PorQ family protein, partial [Spirochaetes bacterium]|nr:PorV/PorQ family protein [Spirochaetota bacterium]